jgi:hypothetical protein
MSGRDLEAIAAAGDEVLFAVGRVLRYFGAVDVSRSRTSTFLKRDTARRVILGR